jgi:hypothetical protein
VRVFYVVINSTQVFASFEVEVVVLKSNIVQTYGILGLCFTLIMIQHNLSESKFVGRVEDIMCS